MWRLGGGKYAFARVLHGRYWHDWLCGIGLVLELLLHFNQNLLRSLKKQKRSHLAGLGTIIIQYVKLLELCTALNF